MTKLTSLEKNHLEKLFGMGGGYVLSFSDRTFNEYFYETFNIDVTHEKYLKKGTSKANRLRSFWEQESNFNVSKVITDFINLWESEKKLNGIPIDILESTLCEECRKIASKLKSEIQVENIEALQSINDEKEFIVLIEQIHVSIEKDNPEAAIDRLHTYLVKYLRTLCERHNLTFDKN